MLKKLFGFKKNESTEGKGKNEETVYAPLTGKMISLDEVPDPVFSQKMMGDGIAIEPTEGVVVSPVEGEVIQLFHTKHAVGIRSTTGAEILIHIGLETVNMKGEGFEAHVKEGHKVKVGDTLITCDLQLIKEKAASTITPMVVTNGDIVQSFEKAPVGQVERGNGKAFELKVK